LQRAGSHIEEAARGLVVMVVILMAGTACSEGEASGTKPPTAGAVIDSALPIEEALRRFREGLAEPAGLRSGAPDRESLVRALVAALEVRDTAGLRALALDAEEFAWLYYPSSPMSRPPYQLAPDLMWMQLQGQSEKGASLLLSDRAGGPLGYVGHRCESGRAEGENRIFGHCVVRRVATQGDTVEERLFGLIVERAGIYKFVSYANKLD
jgi:hypothetical protein